MDLTKRELENRLNAPIQSMQNKEQQRLKSEQNKSLQEFVNLASEKVSKLRSDANNAQSSFKVHTVFLPQTSLSSPISIA